MGSIYTKTDLSGCSYLTETANWKILKQSFMERLTGSPTTEEMPRDRGDIQGSRSPWGWEIKLNGRL